MQNTISVDSFLLTRRGEQEYIFNCHWMVKTDWDLQRWSSCHIMHVLSCKWIQTSYYISTRWKFKHILNTHPHQKKSYDVMRTLIGPIYYLVILTLSCLFSKADLLCPPSDWPPKISLRSSPSSSSPSPRSPINAFLAASALQYKPNIKHVWQGQAIFVYIFSFLVVSFTHKVLK